MARGWSRALDSGLRQSLSRRWADVNASAVSSGRVRFLIHQDLLFKLEVGQFGGKWEPVTNDWIKVEANSDALSLRQPQAEVGDVVLMDQSGDMLPMIYLGELTFADDEKSRSFFLFPGLQGTGLEVNTMPPRWHYGALKKSRLVTATAEGRSGDWINQHFDAPGVTVRWRNRRPPFAGNMPCKWWGTGARYRVVRLKNTADYQLPRELRFEYRDGPENDWALAKWENDQRAEWGETGDDSEFYSKGEILFTIEQPWDVLYRRLGKYGLPADPDPVTTFDVLLGVIGDPPSEKTYLSGHRIESITEDSVVVTPVVRVPYDSVFLPDEPAAPANPPEFKWIEIDVSANRAAYTWNLETLNTQLNQVEIANGLLVTKKVLETYLRVLATVAEAPVGRGKKAANAWITTILRKAANSPARNRALARLIANALAVAELDDALASASLAASKEFITELLRSQELIEYFRMKRTQDGASQTSPRFKEDNAHLVRAAEKAAVTFTLELASACLTNALQQSPRHSADITAYIVATVDDNADALLELIGAEQKKAMQEAVAKTLVDAMVASTLKPYFNALQKSNTPEEFQREFIREFQNWAVDSMKSAVGSAVKIGL